MLSADFNIVLPEAVLAVFAMAALIFGFYSGKENAASRILWATSAVMVAIAIWISTSAPGAYTAFNGAFVDDSFARFCKIIILLSTAAILLMGQEYMLRRTMLRFEFPVLVALSVVGMMMMVSAGGLLAFYIGLELQSLALYVIASLNRNSAKSTESGLNYFVLGALSSGILVYGASLIYGFAGSTAFSDIIQSAQGQMPLGLLLGLGFVIIGLAFKVAAPPFHMWAPDIYEGSATPVTAFFATAPKMAALGLFARVLHDVFGLAVADWRQIIALLAILSMFLGAVAAIGQRNIKRMMAYLSISHTGFALTGLAAGTVYGVQAMLVYMAIYISMSIGVFAFIISMQKDGRTVTDILSLKQLSSRQPVKAAALLVLFFSMAGVPPMFGFFGKLYVLKAAIDADMVYLALAGGIASVIGAFSCLRVVYYIYFGDSDDETLDQRTAPVLWGFLMVSAAVMALGMINMFGIDTVAATAAQALVK